MVQDRHHDNGAWHQCHSDHEHPAGRRNLCALVHSVHSMAAVTCQEAVSGHVTEENAGKTILPEILNIFETKKYLKNEPDRGTM